MHDETNVPVITYIQGGCKDGGITVEEVAYVVDALLSRFSFNHREGLVWKLLNNLVNGNFHSFNGKGTNVGSFGCVI